MLNGKLEAMPPERGWSLWTWKRIVHDVASGFLRCALTNAMHTINELQEDGVVGRLVKADHATAAMMEVEPLHV